MRVKDLKVKDLLDKSPGCYLPASHALASYLLGQTDSLEVLEDAFDAWQQEDTLYTEDLYDITYKLELYHNIGFHDLLDGEEEAMRLLIQINRIQLIKTYWNVLDTYHLSKQPSQYLNDTPKHKMEEDLMSGDDEIVEAKELLEAAAKDLEHEGRMKLNIGEAALEKWEDTLGPEQYLLPDAPDEEIVPDQSKDENLDAQNFFGSQHDEHMGDGRDGEYVDESDDYLSTADDEGDDGGASDDAYVDDDDMIEI